LAATATTSIDQGVDLADCATDFEGDPRPHGSGPDIGADEYQTNHLFTDGFESGNTLAWSADRS
jgi:hypothetical protein